MPRSTREQRAITMPDWTSTALTKNIQISEIIRQLFSMLRGSLFTFIFWLGGLG